MALTDIYGGVERGIARGLFIRLDHGSQYLSAGGGRPAAAENNLFKPRPPFPPTRILGEPATVGRFT